MVQTKQEIITDDDPVTAAFLQSLQSSMPSTQQSTPVALTSAMAPSLLSGRYSTSYVKSERSLKSPHCSREQVGVMESFFLIFTIVCVSISNLVIQLLFYNYNTSHNFS